MSSHSTEFFSSEGIQPDEVALLRPFAREGTRVSLASDIREIRHLLESGLNMAEVILPETAPQRIEQLSLFE